ncbi:hypothetical protein WA158_002060 [Blastocystis sp. Blastoise]
MSETPINNEQMQPVEAPAPIVNPVPEPEIPVPQPQVEQQLPAPQLVDEISIEPQAAPITETVPIHEQPAVPQPVVEEPKEEPVADEEAIKQEDESAPVAAPSNGKKTYEKRAKKEQPVYAEDDFEDEEDDIPEPEDDEDEWSSDDNKKKKSKKINKRKQYFDDDDDDMDDYESPRKRRKTTRAKKTPAVPRAPRVKDPESIAALKTMAKVMGFGSRLCRGLKSLSVEEQQKTLKERLIKEGAEIAGEYPTEEEIDKAAYKIEEAEEEKYKQRDEDLQTSGRGSRKAAQAAKEMLKRVCLCISSLLFY